MTPSYRSDTLVDRPAEQVVAVSDNGPKSNNGPKSDNYSDRSALAMFGTLTGIATLSAVLVVGGAVLGALLDDVTSAPHVFLFLGLILGSVAAVLATRSIIRRSFP
jgi:F0F1-type ATP synthase assembly protein I